MVPPPQEEGPLWITMTYNNDSSIYVKKQQIRSVTTIRKLDLSVGE